MEVADQWRRHWAGTAQYGKVVEGGVTTRVARAVEVMQANGPGARVRVMRAAYHQTSGPGAPATSFLMHSSRRVISSGFDLLEPPAFPQEPVAISSKPLEISSTPLDASPERTTEENYKVTEPDDFDISEPSKWRSSTTNSVKLPSEESSSVDNASIIDLDSRHRNAFRKYSYDSENSDVSFPRKSHRVSPLLESPEDLSTLKYKSLLTGNNDWNNRRKSYSFEDTSPLNETVLRSNNTVAMESSTDSGICKSTELVNDADDTYFDRNNKKEESFKDWLNKNRATPFYRSNQNKPYREHLTVIEDPLESNIALKSAGKLSITVPIRVADDYEYKKSEDSERRTKKVEFCKTELHFTADSGKVNIIATDEKPPPANDFRRRKSAFVPIRGKFEEKPITLFGDTSKDFYGVSKSDFLSINEINEVDENSAATKSILKNKIPKPKPYLLGENMEFEPNDENMITKENRTKMESRAPSGVNLINRQLQQRRYSDESTALASECVEPPCVQKMAYKTTHKGLSKHDELVSGYKIGDSITNDAKRSVQNTLNVEKTSPALGKSRTRQLRDSELTYFGVDTNNKKNKTEFRPSKEYKPKIEKNYDDVFQSVRLIQKVNSACNSEAESEDMHEYQNLPLITSYAPVPTPKTRTKIPIEYQSPTVTLKPVSEQDNEDNFATRRSRHRKQEESTSSSRSISEPPKHRYKVKERSPRRHDHIRHSELEKRSPRRHDHIRHSELEKRSPTPRFGELMEHNMQEDKSQNKSERSSTRKRIEEPLYVNVRAHETLKKHDTKMETKHKSNQRRKPESKTETNPNLRKSEIIITDIKLSPILHEKCTTQDETTHDRKKSEKIEFKPEAYEEVKKENLRKKYQAINERSVKVRQESDNDSSQKTPKIAEKRTRTEKLCTPEYSSDTIKQKMRDSSTSRRRLSYDKIDENATAHKSKTHKSRSTQGIKRNVEIRSSEERPERHRDIDVRKSKRNNEDTDKHTITSQSTQHSSSTRKNEQSNKVHQNLINSYDGRRNLSTPRTKDGGSAEISTNSKPGHDKKKASKYVINYNDTNGTVSSVCKVKPIPGAERKELVTNGIRAKSKDRKTKNKSPDRKSALQYPDVHDEDWQFVQPTDMSRADYRSNYRSNMHVQRTCQII